jgi:preprotein translocase subunit SecF
MQRMYRIIPNRSIWLSISGTLIVLSILMVSVWGLKLGIDFTGGSLLEVKFKQAAPAVTVIEDSLKDLKLNSLSVQPTENSVILRFQANDEITHQNVITDLKKLGDLEELNFTAIGPSVGQEMQQKAVYAIILVLFAISIYIAFAFRKISKPVSSWKYGIATLIALFHDVCIVIGFFALLGKFYGVEVNTSFVAAVLTVLGFSVHDTIVVFDRIRENLPKSVGSFEDTVNNSVNQTLTRSINTSLTVMITLLCITLLGGASIKYFAMALLVGIFFGTYSSIFLASPLLVLFNTSHPKKGKK